MVGKPSSTVMHDIDNDNNVPTDKSEWQTHKYEIIMGNDGNAFRMNSVTGQLFINKQDGCLRDDDNERTSCSTIDFERRDKFLLIVKVTDTGVTGTDILSGTGVLTVIINDVNEAPRLFPVTFWQNEQTPVRSPQIVYNKLVGTPLILGRNVGDEDGDRIRFDITDSRLGSDGFPFEVDYQSGQISVAGDGLLDRHHGLLAVGSVL